MNRSQARITYFVGSVPSFLPPCPFSPKQAASKKDCFLSCYFSAQNCPPKATHVEKDIVKLYLCIKMQLGETDF